MSTRCRHCNSTSYGHGCQYGPDHLHEHIDDEKHCEWCGSSSYGHGCQYGPNRLHRHGHGGGKCIWCGSTSTGSGCPYSPTHRHERETGLARRGISMPASLVFGRRRRRRGFATRS